MIAATKTYRRPFMLLTLLMVLCLVLNISLGSVTIPFDTVWKGIFGAEIPKASWEHIIFQYRIPKAVTALLVGSGLGVSGLLMQTLFRNPMAGPFVLGISSGASLGVAVLIMGSAGIGGVVGGVLISKWSLVIASSIGSFLVLSVVLAIATRIRDTMTLLIIGLMFGSMTAAIVSVLAYFAPAEGIQQYVFWGFGSLGNLSWSELSVFAIVFALGVLLSVFCIKALNTLLLGENYARSLGTNLAQTRIVLILATSLLAGSVTAFAGPIAFVGLAIPHLARLFFDTSDHKILVPAVMVLGGCIMLLCDSIAQMPSSMYTLPINAITALFGAPVVIWLLVRKRKVLF